MAECEVDCMNEAVVEESLILRHTEMEEGPIGPDLLWCKDLFVISFGIVVASHELIGLHLLELL
jgi:hypothetical protein